MSYPDKKSDNTDTMQDEHRRLQRQNAVLAQLARLELAARGGFFDLLQHIAEAATDTLGVERAGIWVLDKAHTRLRCIELFERSPRRHSAGGVLRLEQCPTYFRTLERARIIAADDACEDYRTAEFSRSYLLPLGITSMLDAPVIVGANLIGVICHEHVGSPRKWLPDEQHFAASLGDFIALAIETHRRRCAEAALRRSEESLTTAQHVARIGSWDWNLQTNRFRWSKELYNVLRVDPKRHKTGFSGFIELVHPDDRCAVKQFIDDVRRSSGGSSLEHRIVLRGGEERVVEEHAEVKLDTEGRAVRILGVVRDVTDPRYAAARMQTLSSAVDQAADSVMITDRSGRIEYVNPAFEVMSGYVAAEVIGRTPRVIRSGKHGARFYGQLWNSIIKGEVFRGVFVNRRKDGSLYYEEKTITPLKDTEGNITHFVATGKDITQSRQDRERLYFLANYDVLTGLPNRVLFMDRLEHALTRSRGADPRTGRRRLAVLFLDLDHFKIINDTLGHDVGDAMLRALATRLTGRLGEGSTVSRLGDDEFGILLEEIADIEDVSATARGILEAVGEAFEVSGADLFLTASIGISIFPEDGREAKVLLKTADVAMHRAKDGGRNRLQFYSADMGAKVFRRLTLETSLRRALERDEFRLLYQPQIALSTGRVVAVEALLRWQHPDLGRVDPGDFIGLLEETGLIVPVGLWVLRSAAAQARAWGDAGVSCARISVNLSSRQFQEPDLVPQVGGILEDVGLHASCLECEITESTLMRDDPFTIGNLTGLRDLGIRLAIDDFGTGYSSLGYLNRFNMDTLKIDRSFVRDIPGDSNGAAIITAIIAMAHSLKMDVVAEGVERQDQCSFLDSAACDAVQGYMFSRPRPSEEITSFLQERLRPEG